MIMIIYTFKISEMVEKCHHFVASSKIYGKEKKLKIIRFNCNRSARFKAVAIMVINIPLRFT